MKIGKIDVEEGKDVEFDQVLLIGDDKSIKVGTPLIKGAVVKAKVLKQSRAKKVAVVKYKHKVRYKRNIGHKQHYTEVEILEVK